MKSRAVRLACVSLLARFAAVAGLAVAAQAWGLTASDALLNRLQPQRDESGTRFVNDFSGTLTAAQRDGLEQRVRAMEQTCGAQLAVVVISSLEGGDIDDFANKLFKRWGVGQKDKNNGVMLLVALQDRKMRIEVGYGLEPILPDVLAARIINEQLRPQFRQGQYAEGLRLGVERMAKIIERGEPPSPSELSSAKTSKSSSLPIVLQLFLTTFFVLFAGLSFTRRKNKRPFQSSGRRYDPNDSWTTGGGWWGGGGFSGGGFGGGGFGGGGFGGGCSGGGGASGGW